ncbi:MAG TPA: hypothetical protein VHK64_09710 [Nocardioidaceae bacterium]|jgi:hypothetical protein|nr:hypothetical protein [Nocardioidaceae bacterium]
MRFRAALAVVLLAGCGKGHVDPPACELALGTALQSGTGFVEMPLETEMTPGGQGGFHVWLAYRIKNAPEGSLKASHEVRRESDGKLLSRGDRKLEVTGYDDDGWWTSDTATPAFLCPTPLGVTVIDLPATIDVTLSDADGNTLATQRVSTKLVCPAAQLDSCQRICTG